MGSSGQMGPGAPPPPGCVGGSSWIVLMALGFATYECRRSLRRIHPTG